MADEHVRLRDVIDQELRAHCMTLGEPELLGQQLVQQGARHAVSTLLANGCSSAFARGMLDSLRRNAEIIAEVAESKGFSRLFDAESNELGTRAWTLDQRAGELEYSSWQPADAFYSKTFSHEQSRAGEAQ
jgi:hypothetical protein